MIYEKKYIVNFICALLIISLHQSVFCNEADIRQYKKSETMSFEEFLYADKSDKNMKTLKLNKNGDVIYMGKVVLNNNGVPLNDNTAYTDNELRILFHAMRIKPKKGCDVTDTLTNGAVGCYVEIPE